MSNTKFATLSQSEEPKSGAQSLDHRVRQRIGTLAVVGHKITHLAGKYGTSRKFVYQQKDKARDALAKEFSKESDQTLTTLSVTKGWRKRVVLSLILTCHSSYQGVVEFFQDVLGLSTSKAGVHNVVYSAVEEARKQNGSQDLSLVKEGAHDEIFQNGKPVLTGVDLKSTYCYLLSLEDTRDGTTWGVRLLDLENQGLKPLRTITDGGKGLRKGQTDAWPDVQRDADIFHALYDVGKLATFLENRALKTISTTSTTEAKIAKAKAKSEGSKYSRSLGLARSRMEEAVCLADEIRTLAEWLQHDILSVTGGDFETKKSLLAFVIDELKGREHLCPHRIRRVRRLLENQGDSLLKFADQVDHQLADLAEELKVSQQLVRAVFELQAIPRSHSRHWEEEACIRTKLRSTFYLVEERVKEIISSVVRASSVVENLNSRLRNYFFLRKTLGPEYLDLLQFFLNHHRFARSAHPERVGKSPRELLTGESHSHWLDILCGEPLATTEQEDFAVEYREAA